MKVTFLGLEFALENLGCEALAYSFANILSTIVKDKKVKCEYTAVVFAASDNIKIPGTEESVKCLKIRYKSLKFWKSLWRLFNESDFIFDFTGGDSFSDIYGKKRFYMPTIIKKMAIKSKSVFVLGPQTYGPYNNKLVKRIAKKVIQKSDYVFTRDILSKEYAEKLSGRSISLAPDVAFCLPYNKVQYCERGQKLEIGFNPSGLLWHGGYEHTKLNMQVDFAEYCYKLLDELMKHSEYRIHLIAHVGTLKGDGVENDYRICCKLHDKYPETVLADTFDSPMEAKSYIANMDVFIGSRMHATIAAFSSGVATIPFSYSRKFEGLYNSVEYEYIIHACEESTQIALEKTLDYINNYQYLQKKVNTSMEKIKAMQTGFSEELRDILEKHINTNS